MLVLDAPWRRNPMASNSPLSQKSFFFSGADKARWHFSVVGGCHKKGSGYVRLVSQTSRTQERWSYVGCPVAPQDLDTKDRIKVMGDAYCKIESTVYPRSRHSWIFVFSEDCLRSIPHKKKRSSGRACFQNRSNERVRLKNRPTEMYKNTSWSLFQTD